MQDFDAAAKVRERLIRYARVDTQSRHFEGSWPTTRTQFDLARMLRDELEDMGADDVWLDEEACVVYALLPSTRPDGGGLPFGLIAHMDTAPDAPGSGVNPWVLEHYDGGDIVLNPEKHIVMRADEYPNLAQYIGQDLVLTDGTTLLGGDDKASIAAIMTMAEYDLTHPEALHGPIALAFTPDEEVGGLARDLDLARFGAKIAYTLDGDHLGWYEDETFYASEATLKIRGRSVHTGTAKGIMINAADLACSFMSALPQNEKPQCTEGVEGFFHVTMCSATCEEAEVRLIIRDFDRERFEAREALVRSAADRLSDAFGKERIELTITHQYSNMKEVLDTVPYLTENLRRAIQESGLEPVCEPFRGGTDGAQLSFRGLPCPNLGTGGYAYHGPYEHAVAEEMDQCVEIVLNIIRRFVN